MALTLTTDPELPPYPLPGSPPAGDGEPGQHLAALDELRGEAEFALIARRGERPGGRAGAVRRGGTARRARGDRLPAPARGHRPRGRADRRKDGVSGALWLTSARERADAGHTEA